MSNIVLRDASASKNCLILSQNVKYSTFVANVKKNLSYALWENNSGSNSLRESSAICEGLPWSYSKKIFFLSNSFDNDNGDDGDVGADENDKRSVIRGYNNEIEQKAGFHEIGLLTHPALHPLIAHVQLDISSQIVEKKGFQTSSDPWSWSSCVLVIIFL